MSKEIEESIIKSLKLLNEHILKENQTLLSSLEKERQAHTMSVFDLNMKIAELGIALEREKERAEKLEYRLKLISPEEKELRDLKERVKDLVEAVGSHRARKWLTFIDEHGEHYQVGDPDDEELYKVLEEVSSLVE